MAERIEDEELLHKDDGDLVNAEEFMAMQHKFQRAINQHADEIGMTSIGALDITIRPSGETTAPFHWNAWGQSSGKKGYYCNLGAKYLKSTPNITLFKQFSDDQEQVWWEEVYGGISVILDGDKKGIIVESYHDVPHRLILRGSVEEQGEDDNG